MESGWVSLPFLFKHFNGGINLCRDTVLFLGYCLDREKTFQMLPFSPPMECPPKGNSMETYTVFSTNSAKTTRYPNAKIVVIIT